MQAAAVVPAHPADAPAPSAGTPAGVAPTAPTAPAVTSDATGGHADAPHDGTPSGDQAPTPTIPVPAHPAGAETAPPAVSTTPQGATTTPGLVIPTAVPTATVPVVATSELPQSLTVDRERFVRLVDGLEARLRVSGAEGGRAMRMTLRPAELGDVTVRLQIAADGQSATATLLAQNHGTGDLLAQAAGDLRQALADRGLRLDRLEVTAGSLGGGTTDGAPSGAPDPRGQDTRRTHYAFDTRTEAVAELANAEPTAASTTHEGLYVLA
jgi:flagellar hook-length control protein FliK